MRFDLKFSSLTFTQSRYSREVGSNQVNLHLVPFAPSDPHQRNNSNCSSSRSAERWRDPDGGRNGGDLAAAASCHSGRLNPARAKADLSRRYQPGG